MDREVRTSRRKLRLASTLCAAWLVWTSVAHAAPATERPNIVIIVADDLGYSDLASFGGGDIATPNLDRLARSGLRLSGFYAAPTCSPSRAMLMTGVDAHRAGVGNMVESIADNQVGQPGYEGHLTDRVATVAERLSDAGYATLMTGKWHLGQDAEQSPMARGFQHAFALMAGGASHFDLGGLTALEPKAAYLDEGRPVTSLPKNFYSSDAYATRMISYLAATPADQPVFAYLAFTAPHWPLQAPKALIDHYQSRYSDGPMALRARRLSGLAREGLLDKTTRAHDVIPPPADWSRLPAETRSVEARKMAVYAAMVDRLDANVGRVLEELKRSGRLENAYIIFLSDNGAEGFDLGELPGVNAYAARFANAPADIGSANSFVWYGPAWAQAATAPSRLYKAYPTEGGIHTPAFVWAPPGKITPGINRSVTSVLDIAPTVLALAGVAGSGQSFRGRQVAPMEGHSLVPLLADSRQSVRGDDAVLGWELFGTSAIRSGRWKLVHVASPYHGGAWQLFDIEADPSEIDDLSSTQPLILTRMLSLWDDYVRHNGVIIPTATNGN